MHKRPCLSGCVEKTRQLFDRKVVTIKRGEPSFRLFGECLSQPFQEVAEGSIGSSQSILRALSLG